MSLTLDDVEKIAHLARIAVTPEQTQQLLPKLENILALVDKMNQINTDDVAPMAHPLGIATPLREDQVSEANQRDAFQKLAPETKANLYIVPQVIDSE